MFWVYVLRNVLKGRLYTGYTTDLTQRLGQHNHGVTKSTKNRGIWELVHSEIFHSRSAAMRREKILKSGKGREELGNMLVKTGP
jgi:putative endonuclease